MVMIKKIKAERLEDAIKEDVKWGLYGGVKSAVFDTDTKRDRKQLIDFRHL